MLIHPSIQPVWDRIYPEPGCFRCKLYLGCKSPKMPLEGKGTKGILIVGEAPGYQEDLAGKPFVGKSGQYLEEVLSCFGIDFRNDCFITNALNCYLTPTIEQPSVKALLQLSSDSQTSTHARKYTEFEVAYCRPYLYKYIRETKPKLVVLLGKYAIQSLLGPYLRQSCSILDLAGTLIPFQLNGYKFFVGVTYHPAFVLRQPVYDKSFRRHIEDYINNYSKHDPKPFEISQAFIYPELDSVSIRELTELFDRLSSYEGYISIDTEYIQRAAEHQLVSLAIAWGKESLEGSVAFTYRDELREPLGRLLSSSTPKVGHNIQADYRVLKLAANIELKNVVWDTKIYEHCLDNRRTTALKLLALRYLGLGDWSYKAREFLEEGEKLYDNNLVWVSKLLDLLAYNLIDAQATWQIAREQINHSAQLSKEELQIVKIAFMGSLVLGDCTVTGIQVDRQTLLHVKETLSQSKKQVIEAMQRHALYAILKRVYRDRAEVTNRNQLAYLIKHNYIKISNKSDVHYTKLGRISTSYESIRNINHPYVKLFIAYHQLDKLENTYVKALEELADSQNVVHPQFSLTSVRSFRSSCTSPNIQNIPKRNEKFAKLIRSIFVPRPGYCFIEADYKAIEFRVAACFWQDPAMLEYVRDPSKDIHRDFAKLLFNTETPTDAQRSIAKNSFVFPILYGASLITIAEHLFNRISDKDREQLGINRVGSYDDKGEQTAMFYVYLAAKLFRSKFKVWYSKREKLVTELQQADAILYYLCGLHVFGPLSPSQTCNYPVQGSAFYLLLTAMILLHKALKRLPLDAKLLGEIHDSVLIEAAKQDADRVQELIRDIMVNQVPKVHTWVTCPLEVDVKVYYNSWGN